MLKVSQPNCNVLSGGIRNLAFFSAELLKFRRFKKWFGSKYFVRPFLSIFENLA